MLKNNSISHDRQLDRLPAGRAAGPTDKVAVADIPRRVEVGVGSRRALPAAEARALSVPALDVAAGVAPLAGVARVHPDHPTAGGLSLVLQEAAQLRE